MRPAEILLKLAGVKAHLPLFVMCTLLAGSRLAAKPHPTPQPTQEERIQHSLETIVIPKLEFREAPLGEALDFLHTQIRQFNSRHGDIPILLETRTQFGPEVPRGIFPDIYAPLDAKNARVTVSLTNIVLLEALRYITGTTNTKFWIRPDGIHIVDLGEPEPLFTRDIPIAPDYFSPTAKAEKSGATEEASKAKRDIVGYLTANNASFPEGSAAILDDSGTRLTVHATLEQLDLIKAILSEAPPWQARPLESYPGPIPGPEVPKINPPIKGFNPFVAQCAAVKRKLQRIILPRVAFDHVPIRDAVKTLSASPKIHDLQLRIDGEATVPGLPDGTEPGGTNNPRISYTARWVSMWDALNAVAQSGELIVRVSPYAVTLEKSEPTLKLTMHEYIPPPQLFSMKSKPSAIREEWEKFAKETIDPELAHSGEWLVGSGAPGMGKSFLYIVPRNRLIVHDTPEYHRKVAELIEKGWREYYASDEWKKRKTR